MSHKTIKETRSELKRWGNYWRHKEYQGGFASTSATARICETLRTGCYIQGTSHQVSHLADNMPEPDHIKVITEAVNKLSEKCKQAIIQKYIKKQPVKGYFLDEAERLLTIA